MGRKVGYRKYDEDTKTINLELPLSAIANLDQLKLLTESSSKTECLVKLLEREIRNVIKPNYFYAVRVFAYEKWLQNKLEGKQGVWDFEKKSYWWVSAEVIRELHLEKRVEFWLGEFEECPLPISLMQFRRNKSEKLNERQSLVKKLKNLTLENMRLKKDMLHLLDELKEHLQQKLA